MTRHSPRMNVKVLMAVLLAGLGVTSAAAQTATPLPEIRVAISTSDQGTALLYADSAGLFRKAGLNVTITKMRSGAEIVAGVVGGSLDIGNASVVTVIEGHARGVPFQMIAPTTYYSADKRDSGLIVPVGSAIKAPRDLIGKNVGVVSLQDIFTLSLLVWLAQHGIDPQGVRFVEMPPPAAAAAMKSCSLLKMRQTCFFLTSRIKGLAMRLYSSNIEVMRTAASRDSLSERSVWTM